MVHSRYRFALIPVSLAALLSVGTNLGEVTPVQGQSLLDVFEALKDAVEKSKDRKGTPATQGDRRIQRLQAGLLRLGEADFDLLEKAYFAACGARSGDIGFEREQFQSNTIGPLRDQISQTKTMMAEEQARVAQDRAKLTADAEAIRAMETTVPQIESSIASCEQHLTPGCSKIANEALATLDKYSQQAGSLKESKDWPTRIYSLEGRALDIRALSYEASKSQDTKTSLISTCGDQIARRKLSDKVFDLPIMWFEPNFTLRHYVCFFHHTDTVNNLSEYADGSVAFYIKQIRLDFVPAEVSKETGNIRYGIKKPVNQGGILALVRVQNGIQSEDVNNTEIAIRFMGELVQRYATPQ